MLERCEGGAEAKGIKVRTRLTAWYEWYEINQESVNESNNERQKRAFKASGYTSPGKCRPDWHSIPPRLFPATSHPCSASFSSRQSPDPL